MHHYLLAALAAGVLCATSAQAQDFEPHGFVRASAGGVVSPESDDTVWAYRAAGTLDIPFTDTIGVQVDASLLGLTDDSDTLSVGSGRLTVYYRDERAVYGAFVSGAAAQGDTVGGAGVAAVVFGANTTYFGTLEFLEAENSANAIWGGSAGVTYFVTDNIAVTGQALVGFSTEDDPTHLMTLRAAAQYRFDGTPVSIGASYAPVFSVDGDRSVVHIAEGNVTFHFGQPTLRAESLEGPSFPSGFGGFTGLGF